MWSGVPGSNRYAAYASTGFSYHFIFRRQLGHLPPTQLDYSKRVTMGREISFVRGLDCVLIMLRVRSLDLLHTVSTPF